MRILAQVFGDVENLSVVERHGHANVAQRGREALQILDGVGVGVEDVGIVEQLARSLGVALNQEVVVGIDAGNHIAPDLVRQQLHHRGFLASLKFADARRKQHFKVALAVFKPTQHRTPEKYVVVSLDIGHDALSGGFRLHSVGRLEVLR